MITEHLLSAAKIQAICASCGAEICVAVMLSVVRQVTSTPGCDNTKILVGGSLNAQSITTLCALDQLPRSLSYCWVTATQLMRL